MEEEPDTPVQGWEPDSEERESTAVCCAGLAAAGQLFLRRLLLMLPECCWLLKYPEFPANRAEESVETEWAGLEYEVEERDVSEEPCERLCPVLCAAAR